MTSWSTATITLAAVVAGALLSFVTTRLTDRSRWQREESHRWDPTRLDAYREFASALLNFNNIAWQITAALGLPSSGQPLDPATGLPALAAAESEISVQWQKMLLLGSPDAILAARTWRHESTRLECFARQILKDSDEFKLAMQDRRLARTRFYAAARADLGITSGEIPADVDVRSKWNALLRGELSSAESASSSQTEPAPDAHNPPAPTPPMLGTPEL